jgi:hypothetical protein
MVEIFAVMTCLYSANFSQPRCELDRQFIFKSAEECQKAVDTWERYKRLPTYNGSMSRKDTCLRKMVSTWEPVK